MSGLNKSSLPQIDLSMDTTLRDSLNAKYGAGATLPPPTNNNTSATNTTQAANNNTAASNTTKPNALPGDTTTKLPIANTGAKGDTTKTATGTATTKADTAKTITAPAEPVVMEDTTSPYTRSDAAVHYVLIYIKDPATPQPSVMSTMAKVDAFNSTQFEVKRLVSKQVIIDSKNKLINVRQFKNKEDVMAYFNVIKKQGQLFNDLKPDQYSLVAISTINFATLLGLKEIEEYEKFFKRVYK